MALINFEDLPSTATPINASNLNNNFNECYNEDSGWIDMQLINNWETYTQDYQKAQYRKIGNQVFLRGLIKSGTTSVPFSSLPQGFIPLLRNYCAVSDDSGTTTMFVNEYGELVIYSYQSWVSLTGASFFVD